MQLKRKSSIVRFFSINFYSQCKSFLTLFYWISYTEMFTCRNFSAHFISRNWKKIINKARPRIRNIQLALNFKCTCVNRIFYELWMTLGFWQPSYVYDTLNCQMGHNSRWWLREHVHRDCDNTMDSENLFEKKKSYSLSQTTLNIEKNIALNRIEEWKRLNLWNSDIRCLVAMVRHHTKSNST